METTARLDLPLLAVAQAAKEMTVNEALTLLDAAVQPVVEGIANTPPAMPSIGQGWLVGSAPTDAFAGKANAVAVWTAGGWRFVPPFDGMAVWCRGAGVVLRMAAGNWVGGAAVGLPSGGMVIDSEARAALAAVLERLRNSGLIAA